MNELKRPTDTQKKLKTKNRERQKQNIQCRPTVTNAKGERKKIEIEKHSTPACKNNQIKNMRMKGDQ